jgi:hypothetical protein
MDDNTLSALRTPRERVCFAQKPIAATKKWLCEQPNNHSAAALHLVPRGRPQASIVLSA